MQILSVHPILTVCVTLWQANEPVSVENLSWHADAAIVLEKSAALAWGKSVDNFAPSNSNAALALLAARNLRLKGAPLDEKQMAAFLEIAERDEVVRPWAHLERGLVAAQNQKWADVVRWLDPWMEKPSEALRGAAMLVFVEALVHVDPQRVLDNASNWQALLPEENLDADAIFLGWVAQAAKNLGQNKIQESYLLRQWLEQPVSLKTPTQPPTPVNTTQKLQRAQVLLDAHRNQQVIAELLALETTLDDEEKCQRAFMLGLAYRKERLYAQAEEQLGQAEKVCNDDERPRRAMFLRAKVVSIRDGLRAVGIIDQFTRKFTNHSMVDDVLFWAGDLYQKRNQWPKAENYFRKIVELTDKGDQCAEAQWRLAWIAYKQQKFTLATQRLETIEADKQCSPQAFDRARAFYWRGRLLQNQKKNNEAIELYKKVAEVAPMSFYAQQAMRRVQERDPNTFGKWRGAFVAPQPAPIALCPGFLVDNPAFGRGVELLLRGLGKEAAQEFLSLRMAKQEVLGGAHASSLGVATQNAKSTQGTIDRCGPSGARLLLTLLLNRAGAYKEAHWRLRTDFESEFDKEPQAVLPGLWFAAYPKAFRPLIESAEKKSSLPPYLLQALAREESALDPQVVSWAGAYGLTQLLLSSGRAAAKLLQPSPALKNAEDLLEPALNSQLGGALLGSMLKRYGHEGLALASYNAGEPIVDPWSKRFAGQDFDVFAEEISIAETRGYVKRVLRTYVIYRWLYEGEAPVLPVAERLPIASP